MPTKTKRVETGLGFSLLARNQQPLKAKGEINGPAKTYRLTPAELEQYRSLPPDRNGDGKAITRKIHPRKMYV